MEAGGGGVAGPVYQMAPIRDGSNRCTSPQRATGQWRLDNTPGAMDYQLCGLQHNLSQHLPAVTNLETCTIYVKNA